MEHDFTLITSIISIVLTFLVTYVIAVVKLRKNIELKFDVELQKNRIIQKNLEDIAFIKKNSKHRNRCKKKWIVKNC